MQITVQQAIHVALIQIPPGVYDVTYANGKIILSSSNFSVSLPDTPVIRLLLGLDLDATPPLNEKLGEKVIDIREKSKDKPVEPHTPEP